MGRPPKPAEQKYVRKWVTFPPEVWAELEAIPERERSAFVTAAVRKALAEKGGGQ